MQSLLDSCEQHLVARGQRGKDLLSFGYAGEHALCALLRVPLQYLAADREPKCPAACEVQALDRTVGLDQFVALAIDEADPAMRHERDPVVTVEHDCGVALTKRTSRAALSRRHDDQIVGRRSERNEILEVKLVRGKVIGAPRRRPITRRQRPPRNSGPATAAGRSKTR